MRTKSCRNSSSVSALKRGSPFSAKARPISSQSSVVRCSERRRQDHAGLEAHVLLLRRDKLCDGFGKLFESAPGVRLVAIDAALELVDQPLAFAMLALQLVERIVEIGRPLPQLAEQVGVLLRVVQRSPGTRGCSGAIARSRSNRGGVPRAARLAREQVFEPVDHRGERAVLVPQDGQRRDPVAVPATLLSTAEHQHRHGSCAAARSGSGSRSQAT